MTAQTFAPKARTLNVLIQAAFLLAIGSLSAQEPQGWKAVSPGFSTEALVSHNNAMWAAGSNESIAVSTDSGDHWTKMIESSGGSLFLSLAFVGNKFGYAAGTGGIVAFTQDGGTNWIAKQIYPETIFQAAFGDSEHGVIRTRDALLTTQDGGKTWKPVIPENYKDWTEKSPFTDSVAALDPSHLIVRVSEGQYGSGVFLWTGDGGTTWTANYLPDGAGSGEIFVADGSYWISPVAAMRFQWRSHQQMEFLGSINWFTAMHAIGMDAAAARRRDVLPGKLRLYLSPVFCRPQLETIPR